VKLACIEQDLLFIKHMSIILNFCW